MKRGGAVYLQHFALSEPPFSLTPDPAFVFRSPSYQAALNTVLLALEHGEGFAKVTGEVGTGKTMLGRELLAALQGRCATAYVPHPLLTPREMACALAAEFGVASAARLASSRLHLALQKRLIAAAEAGQRVVVLIDEAHALPTDTLEYVRLLSNLETAKRKLMQLVLLGQPELDERLRSPALRALASRIAFGERLLPMDRAATAQYVAHRLATAGWRAPLPFNAAALWLLHRASGGVPRRINRIAHKALLLAYGAGRMHVTLPMLWQAVRDDAALCGAGRAGPAAVWRHQGLRP